MRLRFWNRRGSEITRRIACAFFALYAAGWSLLPIADAQLEHRRADATQSAELPAVASSVEVFSCALCDLINTGAGVPLAENPVAREPARERVALTPPAYAPVGAPAGRAHSRAPPAI